MVRLIKRQAEENTNVSIMRKVGKNPGGFDYPQFIFSKLQKDPDEKGLLEGYAGIIRWQSLAFFHVNINYSYLFRINIQEATPITPGK